MCEPNISTYLTIIHMRKSVKICKISIHHCIDKQQTADIVTKALPRDKHKRHAAELSMTLA